MGGFAGVAKRLLGRITHKVETLLLIRRLARIAEMAELERIIEAERPALFLSHARASAAKRHEFAGVISRFGIDLEGCRFLDIGPGFGDALDFCREAGAVELDFIERDPWFFTHNRLKGYRGFLLDFQRDLPRLPHTARYDLIWSKASVVADHFLAGTHTLPLECWLDELERLVAPEGATILCPDWHRDDHNEPRLDVWRNPFTAAFLRRGFEAVAVDLHVAAGYPVSFVRIRSSS